MDMWNVPVVQSGQPVQVDGKRGPGVDGAHYPGRVIHLGVSSVDSTHN